MKTCKNLSLFLTFIVVLFSSCSDDSPIKNETAATQKSIAIRTALNELKEYVSVAQAGRSPDMVNPFCFEFVYPLTFSYNNGTTITVATFEGLVDLLNGESPSLFLEAIAFPFQVTSNGAVTTINTENELLTLIDNCGFNSLDDDLLNTYCFDIVFPITIIDGDNQSTTISNLDELKTYILDPTNFETQIDFPITVINQNQTTIINSLYELYELINGCDSTTCICNLEYAPVCVQTPNGIIEFGNMCYAECAGYSQSDIVQCNPNNNPSCLISNQTAVVGVCNAPGTYVLTIDFDVTNTNANQFEVWNSNNVLIGTYSLGSLPVTINDYIMSVTAIPSDNLTIRIGDTCDASIQWIKPNCNCVCTTEVLPVCVQTTTGIVQYSNACLAQCDGFTPNNFVNCTYNFGELLGTCFSMTYPVTVQYQGTTHVVNSNVELLQYWNPTVSQMPIMNYPITVIFGNSMNTYANQLSFESQIHISCP